ncbi:MAG: rRNA maturation RNase YbeY [Duodenibacillus sp.]|nr:rRNA maturation RNase YbeY [Duodenibacillus sp.]
MSEFDVQIAFERADDTARRLPTRREMREWMTAAASVDMDVSVRFVGLEEGRELNRMYRDKDYATNVLTFDYAHEPVAQADLVICTDVLVREAAEQKKSFRSHLAHLLIHGVLHAQGWDHMTDEEAEEMEALETRLMKSLGFADPYSDRARAH